MTRSTWRGPCSARSRCSRAAAGFTRGRWATSRPAPDFESSSKRAARGRRVVTLDAGCSHELDSETLTEAAAREPERLGVVPELASEPRVRYHDPCRASRGRAVTKAPRTVLERALGRAPDEFSNHHSESTCSGAAACSRSASRRSLPRSPTSACATTNAWAGVVVTGCASSLARFRSRGARVLDMAEVLRMSVRAGSGR